ncbi:aldolase [Sphingobium sufflavum]|uniref:HPr kinase/phosphorylase n=1 Tax=Sphingobium sufflavum TaxID=1129547 RepID=UPI001F3816B9|nr:aldolase [Sphingobium sufflavum]MCE7797818.1 aldolase [Sphingobium sufflavum]
MSDAAAASAPHLLHATSVAIGGRVVLLMGASGSGKSDLGLRLIDRGATLVSDDYTELALRDGRLFASPPATIAGQMEVRHVGILSFPHLHNLPVALAIRLDDKPERMPDRRQSIPLSGVEIPVLCLDAREGSAPIKVELALRDMGIEDFPGQ